MPNFEVLPGLPSSGAPPEPFSPTGQGKHREGFVVKFTLDTGESWIGNFQPGGPGCNAAVDHPDGKMVIVVSGGQGYFVEPPTRRCVCTFGGDIESVFQLAESGAVVFGDNTSFDAIGPNGLLWRSGRISWDGMRELTVDGHRLRGLSWHPGDRWVPFTLDLSSGKFDGGSYDGPERFPERWKRLGG